ncbi:phosphopantetheine-binding protein, partial [Streptomyces sp. AK02-01A]|uniref:phosphopantetheine-binding protein n=1 Tax=Streptomyces sp. AK02-01A TaxID=3028648 RepID=UPI0029AFAB1C
PRLPDPPRGGPVRVPWPGVRDPGDPAPGGGAGGGALPCRVLPNGRTPRTPQEEILCNLYAEILNLPTTTIDDNFFDLGGHSLLAAQLTTRIRTTLNINLTIRDIFQSPTIATLTQHTNTHTTTRKRPALRRRTESGSVVQSES